MSGIATHGVRERRHAENSVGIALWRGRGHGARSTGWHYHPGELIAVVHKGTLTRPLEDCSVQTNTPGQSFVEAAGDSHAHSGRKLGAEPVELYVTYMFPAGASLSIDAPDP